MLVPRLSTCVCAPHMNKTMKSNIYAACGAGSCQWVPALRAEPWETVAVMRPFKYIALAVILRTFSYSRQVQSEHASQMATVHCCTVMLFASPLAEGAPP